MHLLAKLTCLGSLLAVAALGSESTAVIDPAVVNTPPVATRPWEISSLNLEQGVLWEIGTGTPFPYRLIETQFSWKSAAIFTRVFDNGSRIILRHRFALIAAIMQQGPESHYIAVSASPSIELWNAAGTWSLYGGAGGGFGGLDSQGVKGGEGQDFTLNWLTRGGIEHIISRNQRISAGIMYQHMSNGGQTKPNPGIDALGFMVGYTWTH